MNLVLEMHVDQLVSYQVFTDSFFWQSHRDMLVKRLRTRRPSWERISPPSEFFRE